MQVEVLATCGLLNSGLDSANFRDHLRVGECQKPFEELAAILWIHKRSAGSFRKFQKQLFLIFLGFSLVSFRPQEEDEHPQHDNP